MERINEHTALKSDWQTEDMPKKNATFGLSKSFSTEQMETLFRGHVPLEMEDKWFWYAESNKLYAHRSWTGICIYIIEFKSDNNHIVTVNRDPNQYACESIEEDRNMIDNLLEQWSAPSYDYYREWISETSDAISRDRFSKQDLLKFCIKESGKKNGASKSIIVSACEDEKALLVISNVDAHNLPPVENKYLIDKTALAEIKTIFIENGMYGWQGKKFSNQFIADGASKSYTFVFSDEDINFSSQKYDEEYALKLDKLNAIIEKYQ